MANRALAIGSQTGALTGVHGDVEIMADALAGHGFEVRRHIEQEATARAIVDAYESLIADSASGDAVVVYYSGHGGRTPNLKRDADPADPAFIQWIVPTDIDDRTGQGFNGILAQELSALQWRLSDVTPNVTTIVDCCHSSRMFRDPDIVPRADRRGFPWADIGARWETVRATAGVGPGDVNPNAVQVVACEPDQSAYELPSPQLGGVHGALTAALVQILRRPDATTLNWREVMELVRPAILDVVPAQRPDVLGEKAARDRLLFSTTTKDTTGVLEVGHNDSTAWLERAGLFGVEVGDRYNLVAPGADRRDERWTGAVDRLDGDRAILTLIGIEPSSLPDGVLAHPLVTALGRRPVAVVPATHPSRDAVVETLRSSPHVTPVEDRSGVLATVSLDGGGAVILDAAGEPLQAAPQPVDAAGLAKLTESLRRLARATHVRELGSGTAEAELADDVAVRYFRLVDGREVELHVGEHVHDGDKLVVRARNGSGERRYVTVLDVGLTGAITILTNAAPSGTTMASGQEVIVGEDVAGSVVGVELYWPEHLPKGGPRPESLITIVANEPIASLPALEQGGVRTRSVTRAVRSGIDLLIEDVASGTRDARPVAVATTSTRYRVHRLDFVVHPTRRPAPGDEPPFEIDERPDPSFRLVLPRSRVTPPRHLSVRLADLVVHSNRSFLRTKVRVDFLVVTAADRDGVAPYQAQTLTVDRVGDEQRLPLDGPLLYDGPVHRFVDLAVWVSRGDKGDQHLSDLLASSLSDPAVAGSVTTLAALATAAPPAAVIAGSMAAVGTLVRTSANLIRKVVGDSIGLYRTSFLPHERFGAGEPALRHPQAGMIRAQDMSLAFEVIAGAEED